MVLQKPGQDGRGSVGAARGTVPSAQSTKLSRRIGWLNANGGLAGPIQFSEVAELLSGIGDVEAMRILKDVEEKGAQVRDPTAYLKAAARRAQGGAPVASARPPAGRPPIDGGVSGYRAAPAAAMAWGGAADADTRLRKRIGWMNNNLSLKEQLNYDKVGPLLLQVGDREAMDILKSLEESAADVRDPTGWVAAAARRLLGGGGGGLFASNVQPAMAALPMLQTTSAVKGVIRTISSVSKHGTLPPGSSTLLGQLKKRVGWLNANASLKAPLAFEKVGHLLVPLGHRQAMDVLKQLEEKAASVNDPTAWVASAARKGAAGVVQAAIPGGFVGAGAVEWADEKVRKRIGWLNSNVELAAPITYDKVAPCLLGLDVHAAMAVLKDLEENAASVRDPDAWVISAARRAAGTAPGLGAPAAVFAAAGGGGLFDPAAEEKLWRRIGWLNKNAALQAKLDYDRLAPGLLAIGSHDAMEILKHLEENAATIRDPSAYALAAALRRQDGGSGMAAAAVGYEQEPPEQRLRKRIGWLNRNGQLAAEIRVNEAVSVLRSLPIQRAMELLKSLEDKASEIQDPTGYVLAAAAASSTDATQTTSIADRASASPEEKLRKRLEWMNRNLPLTQPLDYARLAPEMLLLDPRKAMEVLKKLEESSAGVRDPTAWVLGATKRELGPAATGAGSEAALKQRMAWLNQNLQLASPIMFDVVGPVLMQLELRVAMELLKGLEQDATSVLDPNEYLATAAAAAGPGKPYGAVAPAGG